MTNCRSILVSGLMLAGLLNISFGHATEQSLTGGRGAGVNFPVSCSAEAQTRFNGALAALHSFWYAQALKEFTNLAADEPNCAMAQWGIALSSWNQLWAPPRAEALTRGTAAIGKALEIKPQTDREHRYIEAAAAFFSDSDKLPHTVRAKLYADAMAMIHKSYPDDVETSAFYALSLLATADPLDDTFTQQKAAGKILEGIFSALPEHPGAAHYLIHAYDCRPLAELARPAAETFAKAAIFVPHAIHMPSHTNVLLGSWKEVIESNEAGQLAELDRGIPEDRLHDIDYLVYAYLQSGQEAKAKSALDLGMSIEADLRAKGRDVGLRSRPFTIAAIEARWTLERGRWDEALALQPRPGRFPYIEAIPYYAHAIGSARGGHPELAMEDIKKLADLRDALNSSANLYWGRQVDIEHKIASAWLAYAEKHDVDAEASMRAATKLEETTETHDTLSPGPVGSTAHEALGELLLLRGDAPGALASFEKSLELAKRRSRSYYGAIKAAAIMGDADVQKKYLTALAEVCGFKDGAVHATVDLSSPALGGLPCAAIAHD